MSWSSDDNNEEMYKQRLSVNRQSEDQVWIYINNTKISTGTRPIRRVSESGINEMLAKKIDTSRLFPQERKASDNKPYEEKAEEEKDHAEKVWSVGS